jgi:hypothetical protein
MKLSQVYYDIPALLHLEFNLPFNTVTPTDTSVTQSLTIAFEVMYRTQLFKLLTWKWNLLVPELFPQIIKCVYCRPALLTILEFTFRTVGSEPGGGGQALCCLQP